MHAPVQHLNLPEMQLNINPVVTYSDMFAQVYNHCLVQFHFPIYRGIKENQYYNIKNINRLSNKTHILRTLFLITYFKTYVTIKIYILKTFQYLF